MGILYFLWYLKTGSCMHIRSIMQVEVVLYMATEKLKIKL
jgi:hypothetical protein